jgi:hypothetical protein
MPELCQNFSSLFTENTVHITQPVSVTQFLSATESISDASSCHTAVIIYRVRVTYTAHISYTVRVSYTDQTVYASLHRNRMLCFALKVQRNIYNTRNFVVCLDIFAHF